MKDFDQIKKRMGRLDRVVAEKTKSHACLRCGKLCPVTAIECWYCGANLIKDALQMPKKGFV